MVEIEDISTLEATDRSDQEPRGVESQRSFSLCDGPPAAVLVGIDSILEKNEFPGRNSQREARLEQVF